MGGQNLRENMNSEYQGVNNDMYRFHLILFSDSDEMHELWLPVVPEGFFRFTESPEHRFLSIVAKNGQWVAACRKPAWFQNDGRDEIPIKDGQLLNIEIHEHTYTLYVEKVSKDMMVFRNYPMKHDVEISIGSQPANAICCQNPYISRRHAVMQRVGGQWSIRDCGSIYGVYVNSERKTETLLRMGDVIYIIGLRIIVGTDFLSIAGNTDKLTVNSEIFQEMASGIGGYSHYYGQEMATTSEKFFNRRPRKKTEGEPKVITVEGPPMSMAKSQMPLMLRMGSSMVMGGTAALAGNFTTLLSSVLFPLLSSKYTDKQRNEYEHLRLTKYTEYLEMKRKEILEACRDEYSYLNRKYPSLQDVTAFAKTKEHLWERRPGDTDFLHVRIGVGAQPLNAQIDYPPRRFELEPDALEEKMYQMVEQKYTVDKAPIILPMAEMSVCGVLGDRAQALELVKKIVLQLAYFHSYDEVKMVFLLRHEELEALDFLRYLPHAWDDNRAIRFIATNEAEAYAVGEYVKGQLEGEKDEALTKILKNRPYYLVFALDKKLLECHEIIKEILQADSNRGISIISVYEDLPKEAQKIITLSQGGRNICTTLDANGGEDTAFTLDYCSAEAQAQTMRILANTNLKTVTQAQAMPKMVTFLEMFKAGQVEHLNPWKRWQENNPAKSLAAPVGVGADGSLFMLDLHEKRQGPHGLVAGMTGSGKSEFIITYILSMAVNYHPDEVAFVLIDYKGGGLAGAFENPQTGVRLPHLVGTITNLDGASIQRSLMSIESELIRRQKVFNEVKSLVNEGTMNIYTYQKLYRAGKVSKPMPHLFIISDEFAELKQQQPEFMEKLISAARIGRSLGVHLILATQKPSGVVNDQIRSNTKFRVCLRVQERADSMDMLKRTEAAELTDTGRFYLQVGYNEFFALGQSAWCGAQYEPQETVPVQRDDAVEFLDITGQVTAKAKPKVKKIDSGKKQIVAVVEYLSELAKAHNIKPQPLWTPELPLAIDLDKLNQGKNGDTDSSMTVSLGILDNPQKQKQFPLKFNFETCGNLLIAGDSGGGKTAIIQSILYALTKKLSPEDFQFYALDYSSRMLKLFKSLPHCGAILQEEDEDSLDEFFALINSLIAERKKLFSEADVDNFASARTELKLPLVFVIIDNIAGLTSTKAGEKHNYRLQSYIKDSFNYGIKYIITCSHINEVSLRVRNELREHICLHLKDRYDYSELLGCKVTYLPPEHAGRGLFNFEGEPLELQTCVIKANATDRERVSFLKDSIRKLCIEYNGALGARHLRVIDEEAEFEDFAAQFSKGRIPLGYSKKTRKPVALPLQQFTSLNVYLGNPEGRLPVLHNFMHAAKRENMNVWVVCRKEKSSFNNEHELSAEYLSNYNLKRFDITQEGISAFKQALLSEVNARLEIAKGFAQAKSANKITAVGKTDDVSLFKAYMQQQTKPVMILFENLADLCQTVDVDSENIINKLLGLTKKLNMFTVSFVFPDDHIKSSKGMLFGCITRGGDTILLGGRYHQQDLVGISQENSNRIEQFNQGLMRYRQHSYPFLMPCGKMQTLNNDPDTENIFEQE